MALNNTVKSMKGLLEEITADLGKAERGNKAAAQRVRVNTIRLEKTAKLYRKESIAAEKKESKAKPAAKKPAAKKATAKMPKKKK
ncbi:MAG: histone [Chlamydiae bacterium]|nr:histone [Chlamydiota bacterium]